MELAQKLGVYAVYNTPTSNILLRIVDTRNYATENCVW